MCGVTIIHTMYKPSLNKKAVLPTYCYRPTPSMFMMRLLQSLAFIGRTIAQDVDYSQFVNPFIGSEGAIPGYACEWTLVISNIYY
jgi:hypothetical protein